MKEGDIIIVPMQQASGQAKNRPSLVLKEMPRYNDLLVCGISTQLHQMIRDFDEIIAPTDGGFFSQRITKRVIDPLGIFVFGSPRPNYRRDRCCCSGKASTALPATGGLPVIVVGGAAQSTYTNSLVLSSAKQRSTNAAADAGVSFSAVAFGSGIARLSAALFSAVIVAV